jgi:putative redox protein
MDAALWAACAVMPSTAKTSVVVRGTGSGFAQKISAGEHHLVVDEPLSAGGTDTGPTPYEFLLAALGACTAMTVTMYARRKNWPLVGIVVRLSHSKIHAEDCFECHTEAGFLDRIDCEIELTGSLSPDERLRLLEIAEKCPVHRTLTSEISIHACLK